MSDAGGTNPLARLAALGAVVISVAALGIVVATSVGGDDDGGETVESGTTDQEACDPEADNAVKEGYILVNEPEDVVAVIAERTCIDQDVITELNPDIDPNALQLGACINLDERLRCKKVED
jgi:hypothetical protein